MRGSPTLEGVHQYIVWPNTYWKLHENERIWIQRGVHVPCIPMDPPLGCRSIFCDSGGSKRWISRVWAPPHPQPHPRQNHPKLFNFMLQLSVNDTLHSKSIVCYIANLLLKDCVKSCKKILRIISQSDFPALTIHVFNILPSVMVSFPPLMLKIVTFDITIVRRNLWLSNSNDLKSLGEYQSLIAFIS